MRSAMEKASAAIDLALVDVNLMDGATGPLIAEKLASEFGIEVVFVTANPTQFGGGGAWRNRSSGKAGRSKYSQAGA